MLSNDEEDNQPSWLDTENDQMHRNEVKPLLFGKGKLDLTDPNETDEDTGNPFSASDDHSDTSRSKASKTKPEPKKQLSTKGYGSTDISSPKNSIWTILTPVTSPPKNEKVTNENWHEESNDGSVQSGGSHSDNHVVDEEAVMDEETFHEETGHPLEPKRHCIVKTFFTVETFAVATNLVLLLSQVLPLIFMTWETENMAYIALKIYLCVFSFILLLVEIDHPSIPFLRKASFLRTFASRGFMYTFFALVCFEEADSEMAYKALEIKMEKMTGIFSVSWLALVNQIAAWSLIALGILYFLMGILCLQRVRNRYVYDDRKKWNAYREALEKWDQGL